MKLHTVTILLVFGIILLSSFIHASTAYGFSVFAMTLLPMFLPLVSAAAIVRVALLIITFIMVFNLRKHINYKFILVPSAFSLVGNSLGFYLLMTVNADILKRVLGGMLVLIGIYMFFFCGKFKIKKSFIAGMCIGFISGIVGGMFNLGGVVLVIYYYSAIEDKLEYSASLQGTFVFTAIYGVLLSIIFGDFSTTDVLGYTFATIVAVIIGSLIGLKVLHKINKQTLGRLSYVYMILMGLIMAINIPGLINS